MTAEFTGQKKVKRLSLGKGQGFDAMGKPIPLERRTNAVQHCRAMGMTNTEDIWTVVQLMAQQLERDEPYEAVRHGMKYLDLTGTYRLMSVLLCD